MAEWRTEKSKQFWAGVAERLKLLRHLLGISEQEAAAAMWLTLTTYRKWERGERHQDNHFGAFNFCSQYNIEYLWLFGGPKDGSPPRFKLRLVS